MTVEDNKVVDFIGVSRSSGDVVLTISDHLDWSDSQHHQRILQDKLNRYLAFVESGEILESYPDAKGRAVVFSIAFKYPPDHGGEIFLAKAGKTIEDAGFRLSHEVFIPSVKK